MLGEIRPFLAQRFQAIDQLEAHGRWRRANSSWHRPRFENGDVHTGSFWRAVRSERKTTSFVASSGSISPGGRGDNLAFRNQLFTR